MINHYHDSYHFILHCQPSFLTLKVEPIKMSKLVNNKFYIIYEKLSKYQYCYKKTAMCLFKYLKHVVYLCLSFNLSFSKLVYSSQFFT